MEQISRESLFAGIKAAIAKGTREFLTAFRSAWSGESMYAFLYEVNCEGDFIHGAVATEEGLARVAGMYESKGYRAKTGDTATQLKQWLRWAGPEDGWYQGTDLHCFDDAMRLIDQAMAAELMKQYDGTLNELALQTLSALRSTGVFDSTTVLGLCYIGGDNSDEETLEWAEQVNSTPVMDVLRREMLVSRSTSDQILSSWDK